MKGVSVIKCLEGRDGLGFKVLQHMLALYRELIQLMSDRYFNVKGICIHEHS